MKHHAFLGLILGLLAASSLRAQTPVLFTVTFNPDGNIFTITGTGASANSPTGSVPINLNTYDGGITLINFFPGNFTPGNFAPDTEEIPTTGDRSLKVKIGDSELFLDPGFYTGSTILNPPSGAGQNFNLDKNVSLYTSTGTPLLFSAGSISFPIGGAISFTTTNTPTNLSFTTDGPRNVYVGYNDAFSGDGLLGTYTLTVVPEPSTYGAISGGLGLAAAVIHRRRQRAKAAQG